MPSKSSTMIATLADLTRRWGCLHEFQINNLNMWPLVIVNAVKSEFIYDHVSRKITILIDKCSPVPENINEKVQFLAESIQMLLGIDIEFYFECKEPEIKTFIPCPQIYSVKTNAPRI